MGKMRARQRMRRKPREEDLEEEQVLDEATKLAQPPAAAASPADKALELQKTAGNRAVGAALDRFASPFLPSNAPAVAGWPKRPEARFDDDLVVPIESAQDPKAANPGNVGSGSSEREEPNGPGELIITTAGGDFVVELHKAVIQSKHFDKVVIVLPSGGGGIQIILYDVYISSGQISGHSHAWSLSYSKREFSHAPPP